METSKKIYTPTDFAELTVETSWAGCTCRPYSTAQLFPPGWSRATSHPSFRARGLWPLHSVVSLGRSCPFVPKAASLLQAQVLLTGLEHRFCGPECHPGAPQQQRPGSPKAVLSTIYRYSPTDRKPESTFFAKKKKNRQKLRWWLLNSGSLVWDSAHC